MRSITIAGAIALVTALPASAAYAQAPPPGSDDPSASSPPGVVYEIPLDSARHDAAPRDRSGGGKHESGGGSSGSAGGATGDTSVSSGTAAPAPTATPAVAGDTATSSAGTGSSVHSENGFGSSSVVPGAKPTPAAKTKHGRRSKTEKRDTGEDQLSASARESLITPAAAPVAPSVSRVFLLLGLAVLLALGLGFAAWRGSRSR
jgi:hypothetical protein